MEIRDGFIVGIYNYCDAWCDRCRFTSHCRAFADRCRMDATLDPNLEPIVTAPEHPSDVPPPAAPWLQELLDEMNETARTALRDDADVYRRRELPAVPEREAIDRRAESYFRRTRAWLMRQEFDMSRDGHDPRAVIAWFHMMIHVKSMRALHGLAEDDPSERDWPPDHDGAAKVALIGIDRSETAWRDLVEVASRPQPTSRRSLTISSGCAQRWNGRFRKHARSYAPHSTSRTRSRGSCGLD